MAEEPDFIHVLFLQRNQEQSANNILLSPQDEKAAMENMAQCRQLTTAACAMVITNVLDVMENLTLGQFGVRSYSNCFYFFTSSPKYLFSLSI